MVYELVRRANFACGTAAKVDAEMSENVGGEEKLEYVCGGRPEIGKLTHF
jgi:hypothetical protein